MSNKISRRAFLKVTGVSALALGAASMLGGCQSSSGSVEVKVGDKVGDLFALFFEAGVLDDYSGDEVRAVVEEVILFERGVTAPGGEGDIVLVQTYVLRVYDLVGLNVFQHPVLVYARRMREGIPSDYGLVGLHRHIHKA